MNAWSMPVTPAGPAEVRKHIEELAQKGIPGPPATPTLYPVIRRALVKDPVIEVYSRETCGEAEYVLLIENDDRVYVGVGSDHTDRRLEEWDIPRAKQICPNIIGPKVWALEDVAGHWDELTLRCRQVVDSAEILYQEGKLSRLMAPKELMAFVRSRSALRSTVRSFFWHHGRPYRRFCLWYQAFCRAGGPEAQSPSFFRI